jgi:hypothetical protein
MKCRFCRDFPQSSCSQYSLLVSRHFRPIYVPIITLVFQHAHCFCPHCFFLAVVMLKSIAPRIQCVLWKDRKRSHIHSKAQTLSSVETSPFFQLLTLRRVEKTVAGGLDNGRIDGMRRMWTAWKNLSLHFFPPYSPNRSVWNWHICRLGSIYIQIQFLWLLVAQILNFKSTDIPALRLV